MAITLKIHFEGDVPGIQEHRLSVAAFGEVLLHLRQALRREVSNIHAKAEDEAPRSSTGRVHRWAEDVDLEVARVGKGSLGLELHARHGAGRGRNMVLPTIAHAAMLRAVTTVVDDMEQESRGHPTSTVARDTLAKMPPGLTLQRYEVWDDDKKVKEAVVQRVERVDETAPLRGLVDVTGFVVGVAFPPGEPCVHVRGDDDVVVKATASPEQVEQALAMRESRVRAVIVDDRPRRLLWIRKVDQSQKFQDDAERTDHVFRRWADLLEVLAR